jgi:hypothetical protein
LHHIYVMIVLGVYGMNVSLSLDLYCDLINTCKSPELAAPVVATHALLTMGKYLDCAQVEVSEGNVVFNHEFKRLVAEDHYEDELGIRSHVTNEMKMSGIHFEDFVPTDHVILWLYRVSTGVASDGTNRVYLLGAVALDLVALLTASIDPIVTRPSFVVKHNFMKSTVRCTVLHNGTNTATNVIIRDELVQLRETYAAAQVRICHTTRVPRFITNPQP